MPLLPPEILWGGAGGSGGFADGKGQAAKATQVKMTASAIDRTSRLGKMPAYFESVSVMTGTTVKQISSKVMGSCAFACARPAKAMNMTSAMIPKRSWGVWLRKVVSRNASQAQIPMINTRANPTLSGGEPGRLASSTPVNTAASEDGCHPIHSQTMNAAVVPTLKRSTK